jgi:hypothetical protein
LSPEREALGSRLDKATFLTQNEKRAAVGYGPLEEGSNDFAHKFRLDQPRVPAGQSGGGQWTDGSGNDAPADDSDRPQPASRRRSGQGGTPAQETRHAVAAARARDATRRLRELEPTWEGPQSASETIEGRIAHQEATAAAAEARLAEILRDAIPNTNPSWGMNRLTKELYERGFVLKEPARGEGLICRNETTGEELRIMKRPSLGPSRSDPLQKFHNDYYYRYRRRDDQRWGSPITIPNK